MARKVLIINKSRSNNFNLVLTPAQLANYIFEHADDTVENPDHVVIVIGPDDNGERTSTAAVNKLALARNAGIDIIITHSNPGTNVASIADEIPEQYNVRQSIYMNALAENFGFLAVQENYQYQYYSRVATTPTNPFGSLPDAFNVQETHNVGWVLSPDWNIIAVDPNGPPDRSNYYLALLTEAGKGRVLYWNIGHCGFGQGAISNFTAVEKAILLQLLG